MMPISRVVVADPPWKHDDQLPGGGRGASKFYTVMTTEELCRLELPPLEESALLFLWRLSNMPEDALDVCRAWGFTPKSEIVWIKHTRASAHASLERDALLPRGTPAMSALRWMLRAVAPRHMGMGRYVRNGHESCIIATRGRGASLIRNHGIRSVFEAPVGAHSEKPEEFFRIVEALSEGPYVELFARRRRPGWTTLGLELGTTLLTTDAVAAE